jgi:hypothetical protein
MPFRCNWMFFAARGGNHVGWVIAIVIIAVVLVPVFAIIGYLAWKEKRRTAGLKQIAENLGFEFALKEEPATFLDGFPLHASGYGKKLSGLMRGRSESFDVALFDYRYTIGGGKTSQMRQQSVVWFQSSGLDLPDVSLAPRSFWHTLRRWFGQSEIVFENHPAFTKKYVVQGSHESAIRELLSPRVLEFFEQRSRWSLEGLDDRLLMYQPAKRLPPAEFPGLLETGLTVLSLIHAKQ